MENNRRENTTASQSMTGGFDRDTKDLIFNMGMDSLTAAKREARAAGYKKGAILDTDGMYNGHIVEIAVCHLLGVVQRYIAYDFVIRITSELDMEGVDIEIVIDKQRRQKIQLKHTYKAENREKEAGAYILPLHNSRGFEVIEELFRFYHIPFVLKDYKSFTNLRIELDYIWLMYTESLNNHYASRY